MTQRYTAKEIAEILKAEGDIEITIRTIRFYTDQKYIPELVKEGVKNYTEEHLEYIRALRSLNKAGMPLQDAKKKLDQMSLEEKRQVTFCYQRFKPEVILGTIAMTPEKIGGSVKTVWINDDLAIQYSDKIPILKLKEILSTVRQILKRE